MSPVASREYFSSTMPEADEKFAVACASIGGEARFHVHPLTGPDGETLQTGDFLYGPKDAEKAMIFLSGMHGIEGYAGAALQVGVLASRALNAIPDDVAVLFIHMVNPWGCAWDRRENEDNVDIFRNFVYGDQPADPNPLYDLINSALNPTEWSGPVKQEADAQLSAYQQQHGEEAVAWAIRRGQHNHPKGMTFHGTKATWSRRTMEAIVKNKLGAARRIVGVDLHTGFGGFGETTVMTYADRQSESGRRMIDWYGEGVYFAGSEPMIPQHKRMPMETLVSVLPGAEILPVAVEWGGEPYNAEDFEVFRHMSYLQNYGDLSAPQAQASRQRSRAVLYGASDEWRDKAWTHGHEFFQRTVAGAVGWLNELA